MTEGPRAAPEGSVQNHRAEPRAPVALQIRYSDPGDLEISQGRLADLNTGGACVVTKHPLPVGSRLIIEIPTPEGATTRCAAEIAYSRRGSDGLYRNGAKFLDLDVPDREALQAIVRIDEPTPDPMLGVEETPLPFRPPGPERRRASRFDMTRPVSYKIYGPNGRVEEEGLAEIFNLSLTGVGLLTSGPIRQGISFQLEVVYAGGLKCAIEAECVYCRKNGEHNFVNGLRFTAAERSDLKFFSRILGGSPL